MSKSCPFSLDGLSKFETECLMPLRSVLLSLLLTTSLCGPARAAMLAPETGQPTTTEQKTEKPATISSLKARLAAARGERIPLSATSDSAPNEAFAAPLPAIEEIEATASTPVDQQVVRYKAASASDNSGLHGLLFDDVGEDPVKAAPPVKAPVPAPAPVAAPKPAPKAAIPETKPAAKKNSIYASPGPRYVKHIHEKWDSAPETAPATQAGIPSVEIRKAFKAAPAGADFKPKPSAPSGNWATRALEPSAPGKNDALCLLQNHFNNNLTLVLGQDSSGTAMLAIDYGIEMLESPQDYTAKVQLDKAFEQDLPAYTTSPAKIIIQLGKNPGFFSTLQSAGALHVALPGLASTFSLENLSQGLAGFAQCLNSIGGQALPAAAAMPVPAAPVMEMPNVPIPAISTHELNTPQTVQAVPVAPPIIPASAPAEQMLDPAWRDKAETAIRQSGIAFYDLTKSESGLHWSNSAGQLQARVSAMLSGDILDAASGVIDQQEKSCAGQFGSQMGVPDGDNFLQMESKCVTGSLIIVSTWILHQQGQTTTIWQMASPRDTRGLAFDAREKILSTLKKTGN